MEHYLLLGQTIRRAKDEYAQIEEHHKSWRVLIKGLTEAKALMEECRHVISSLELEGGGWYGVPQNIDLEQSYGILDTYIKR